MWNQWLLAAFLYHVLMLHIKPHVHFSPSNMENVYLMWFTFIHDDMDDNEGQYKKTVCTAKIRPSKTEYRNPVTSLTGNVFNFWIVVKLLFKLVVALLWWVLAQKTPKWVKPAITNITRACNTSGSPLSICFKDSTCHGNLTWCIIAVQPLSMQCLKKDNYLF